MSAEYVMDYVCRVMDILGNAITREYLAGSTPVALNHFPPSVCRVAGGMKNNTIQKNDQLKSYSCACDARRGTNLTKTHHD